MAKRQRAFSLIEAAIVLAIIGLVIGGIWVAASSVRDKMYVTKFVTGFNKIIINAQKYLSQTSTCYTGSYLGVTDPEIWNMIYPQEWRDINIDKFATYVAAFTPCDAGNVRTFSLYFGETTDFGHYNIMPQLTRICTLNGCNMVYGGIHYQSSFNGFILPKK